jgi:hypothetical protein
MVNKGQSTSEFIVLMAAFSFVGLFILWLFASQDPDEGAIAKMQLTAVTNVAKD